MKLQQKDRRTSGLLAVVHDDSPVPRVRTHPGRLAALLGGAAILALAQAAPLQAQTTMTQPADDPATKVEGTAEGTNAQAEPQAESQTEAQTDSQTDSQTGTTDQQGATQALTDKGETTQDGTEQAAAEAQTESAPQEAQEVAPTPVEGQIVEQPEGTYQVTDLIGATVASPQGETIGEVVDLLFSKDNQLAGMVIGIGGFFGFGDKEIAVEANEVMQMQSADGEQQVVLNYTREQLEQAPEFVSLEEQRAAAAEKAARLAQDAQRNDAEQPATKVPTE